jgi:BirA family biotin operon repressor/biotin-[acetyl-CoA-carboxylase] ligase
MKYSSGNSEKDLIVALANGESVPDSPGFRDSLTTLGLAFTVSEAQILLATPLELLDCEKIRHHVNPETIKLVSGIEALWSVDSTNTYLMDRTDEETFHGSVCLAEQQLSGRGRRGRHWVSPFGKNIYLSIGWQMPTATGITGLSLVIGMQVIKSLRSIGLSEVGLKWPNDVLLNGGKLCGILIEISTPGKGFTSVVTGVGVNLRLDIDDVKKIDQPWSAASEFKRVSRNQLGSLLISNLVSELENFSIAGFAPYREQWDEFDIYANQSVCVLFGDKVVEGVDRGVDEHGNLLLETSDGMQTFSAGEVSLRPTTSGPG